MYCPVLAAHHNKTTMKWFPVRPFIFWPLLDLSGPDEFASGLLTCCCLFTGSCVADLLLSAQELRIDAVTSVCRPQFSPQAFGRQRLSLCTWSSVLERQGPVVHLQTQPFGAHLDTFCTKPVYLESNGEHSPLTWVWFVHTRVICTVRLCHADGCRTLMPGLKTWRQHTSSFLFYFSTRELSDLLAQCQAVIANNSC